MGKLVYSAICSLDGCAADERGKFDWAAPNEELHAFINNVERPIGTYLFGRRMYEVMLAWETMQTATSRAVVDDFARIWRSADKIVYSRSLTAVSTRRTRIERRFDPNAVREMLASATRDMSIGGANLAGQAIRAELVDECHLFLVPVTVGGSRLHFR